MTGARCGRARHSVHERMRIMDSSIQQQDDDSLRLCVKGPVDSLVLAAEAKIYIHTRSISNLT